MSAYPKNISDAVREPSHSRELANANATGAEANLGCGCIMRVNLDIDDETGMILGAGYVSNGCGFMVAAAESISKRISGELITDLRGFTTSGDLADLQRVAEAFGRLTCVETAHAAVTAAFSSYRVRKLQEYSGEKALVCTCFGIEEETIERFVEKSQPVSVEEVTVATRAGSGCGSCKMLIQEIIDTRFG